MAHWVAVVLVDGAVAKVGVGKTKSAAIDKVATALHPLTGIPTNICLSALNDPEGILWDGDEILARVGSCNCGSLKRHEK